MKQIAEELRTLRDCIRWGMSQFEAHGLNYGHGMETSLDEAVYLSLYALHLPINLDGSYFDSRLTYDERVTVLKLLKRRFETRKPAAYLTHEAWFAGLRFYVDERVLVPRSPIAELIQQQFEPWIDPQRVARVLDLCTGSGCIAVACGYAFPDAEILATDISEDTLAVAEINRDIHAMHDQLQLLRSDLFDQVPEHSRFDIIVTNPPYVDADDMRTLTEEFHHEPQLGLTAGDDGLELAIPILQQAGNYLQPDGLLVLEVGNSWAALEHRFPDLPMLWPEFEHGGHGVAVISAADLQSYFGQAMKQPA